MYLVLIGHEEKAMPFICKEESEAINFARDYLAINELDCPASLYHLNSLTKKVIA